MFRIEPRGSTVLLFPLTLRAYDYIAATAPPLTEGAMVIDAHALASTLVALAAAGLRVTVAAA